MSTAHVIASSSHPPHSTTASNIVGTHYRVGEKIGEGSSGIVFEGLNLLSSIPVAIKFELRTSDTLRLRNELRCYKILSEIPGIPQVHHFGHEGLHNVLVIDLLGPNMEYLFNLCGRKFPIKTVCMAAKQMLTRVQAVHDKSLIHRDISPDNFLIGVSGSKNTNMIHIINFGMAKLYRDPNTKFHIPYHESKSLSRTMRYMSINTHLGREQSRRDDLESLGYVFIYFLRGGLPWQGLRAANNKQKYEKIGEKKQTTSVNELCEGFPEEFAIYMNYVKKLGFEENPNYDFLRGLFTNVMETIGEPENGVYGWKDRKASINPHVQSATTAAREHRRDRMQLSRNSLKNMSASTTPKSPAEITETGGQELMTMTDLLIRHASKLTNQPDFHGIDHFTPEFGLINRNLQAIKLDIKDWETTLHPFLNDLDKLLVPSNIDTFVNRYCQQCRFFQITYDILTHLKFLRGREEPDIEKYLKSIEEIIRYGEASFDMNFGRIFFGSAAIVGSLMAVLAHRRYQ